MFHRSVKQLPQRIKNALNPPGPERIGLRVFCTRPYPKRKMSEKEKLRTSSLKIQVIQFARVISSHFLSKKLLCAQLLPAGKRHFKRLGKEMDPESF